MKAVVGLFERPQDAERAVEALESAGFLKDEIGAVARDHVIEEYLGQEEAGSVAKGAGLGVAVGGLIGLLAGIVAITVSGIGPVLAAGMLVTMLAGGLIGALIEVGVSEEEAHVYAEGVKRDGVLVAVQSEAGRASLAKEILGRADAVNVETRRQAWVNDGWVGFDQSSAPGLGYPKVWNRPGS
jgi:hypothetical protein